MPRYSTPRQRVADERGVALIATLLIIMLMSALLVGFTTAITSDQRYRLVDRDRVSAFYAAHSGLEQLSTDLAILFYKYVSPTDQQIAALGDTPPEIPGIEFNTDDEALRYGVRAKDEQPEPGPISTGPYQGLIALKKRYELNTTVRTASGGEAHLKRDIETVSIPVFQFGVFSSMDLSFHAGPNFNFGGRVHSNGNLFLAQGDGATLTMSDKVTAVGEVIRRRLANDSLITASNHEGNVRIPTTPGAYRNLASTEGSLVDSIGSAANDPTWTNLSLSTYNGYIRSGRTGARRLDLPLITFGGANTDLVRRPLPGEDNEVGGNPSLLAERYYSKASLRILLSDTATDITSLPQLTNTPPINLAGDWRVNAPAGYGPVDATHPPVALTPTAVWFVSATSAPNQATNTTIQLSPSADIPGYFLLPQLTVTSNGGATTTVNCTGKTSTTFTDCGTRPAGFTLPGTVSMTVNGVTTSTTLTAWPTSGSTAARRTLTVTSTLAFTPNSFWILGTDSLVTCGGYTTALNPHRFLECAHPGGITNGTVLTTGTRADGGTPLVGGWIKIERQDTDGNWSDVTLEILNHGFSDRNLGGFACGDPTPNAIIRLQRLRDNTSASSCNYGTSTDPADYWPNVLYDTREAIARDSAPGGNTLRFAGVVHYVNIDAGNLLGWFAGQGAYAGGSGPGSFSDNGFSVYISDRRNNRNAAGEETGEFGAEDIINPSVADGSGNATLDGGEDVNGNGVLDRYGEDPTWAGAHDAVFPCAANCGVFTTAATAMSTLSAADARRNPAIFFRRAVKLSNGSRAVLNDTGVRGLTVAAESPVYVHGDWNFDADSYANPNLAHLATSIIADSVTVLSNAWSDAASFSSPYATGGRVRNTSYYRFAVIAGKNQAFDPTYGGAPADFGTDGGTHNFLRMLESGGSTVYYRGSMATFFYSRQATGVYKCCATVYAAPGAREFRFDVDFLNPAKLPPLTPMFRDLNALNFRQEFRPGR